MITLAFNSKVKMVDVERPLPSHTGIKKTNFHDSKLFMYCFLSTLEIDCMAVHDQYKNYKYIYIQFAIGKSDLISVYYYLFCTKTVEAIR